MAEQYAIQVRWLTVDEGGRVVPFAGKRYTPTARFTGESEQFSVVLEFPADTVSGSLRLLNPDLVEIEKRIRPGVTLEIMEGTRIVARGVVKSKLLSELSAAAQ